MSPVQRPTRDQVRIFASAADFGAWLEEHHGTETELFVGFYKKGSGRSAMTYPESVDEALCHGWIDGITFRIDDELRATRFTPRRPTSNWSAVNIAKMAALGEAGRLRPAGIRAFETRDRRKDAAYSYERERLRLSEDAERAFRSNADAWAYWEGQTDSYRRTATYWVVSAKQEATRQRRLSQLIADSAAGRPAKPFTYGRSSDRPS
jgi:uncharacterized protein YdeI (YjbR/CyaY-like superfamily)